MISKWIQSTLMLGFSATVLYSGHVGILKAGILKVRFSDKGILFSVPDPPRPLPDSASPYREIAPPEEPSSTLKLELIATEDAWVEVETDGQPFYAKLVHAGQALSFQASERIRVVTGNAPGLQLRFNGQPVANDGATGKVSTLELTSEGMQFVKGTRG